MNPGTLAEQSSVHPVIAAAMLLAAALILLLPERRVIAVFLTAGILIPLDQVLMVGPLHFQMLRVLILLGWIRAITTKVRTGKPLLGTGLNTLDKLVLLYAAADAVDYIVLWQGSSEAFINRFGALYSVLGIYFLFRMLVRNEEDAIRAIRTLAYVSAAVAVVMLIEHAMGQNPYVYLGGSRAWTREALMVREDKLRAMGPFQHPILAGSFGGILLPLFIGLWIRRRQDRFCAVVGMVSVTLIVLASASSTPILSYGAGLFALSLWPLRKQMKIIRWGVAVMLLGLHVVMKAPVWALIQRVDLVGGSSSYHRYYLLDQFIRRFGDWWLFGVKSTDKWGADLWDHANQYVAIGTTSGVLPLVLFLAAIAVAFNLLGRARSRNEDDKKRCLFIWSCAAALFANVVGFFGISYFDQTLMVWWGFLGMIPVLAALRIKAKAVEMIATADPVIPEEPMLVGSLSSRWTTD